MTEDTERFFEVCLTLDDPRITVTDFEADFLESILRYFPEVLSEKRKEVIRQMAWKYLGEEL